MSIFAPTPEMVAAMRAHFAQKESATTPAYTPIVFNAKEHSHLLSSFVDIHIACVQHDDLIATFLPPFTDEKRAKMTKWWQAQFDETEKDERVIVMIMGRASEADVVPSDGPIAEYKYESSAMASAHAASPAQGQILAGYVMLVKPFTETGPFRGPVEKLLISPRFRRRGLARKIMEKLEVVAREAGKTLLVSIPLFSGSRMLTKAAPGYSDW